MIYGSVCSGIEAASAAWHPIGWAPAFFSEIEKYPCAVLAYHYPGVPNYGDMTGFKEWPDANIDVLAGGTPCQSFSIAGLRKGLADPRGNLMLIYLAIAGKYRPRWVVWENVPGVLSSGGRRDFGTFLSGLAELGYGFAYRVLDAQYFGVPQRRRRVFVVGHLGGWRGAAAALFERESLRGRPAAGRREREAVAGTLSARTRGGGGLGTDADLGGYLIPAVSYTINAGGMQRQDAESETLIAHGTQDPCVGSIAYALGRNNGAENAMLDKSSVRRLTPRECERLQGFDDDYTLINYRGRPAADGPRYSALGNSMAVPVMRWIGERIAAVDEIITG